MTRGRLAALEPGPTLSLPRDEPDDFAVFCLMRVALPGVQCVAVLRLESDVATRVAVVVAGNAANGVDRI